MNVQTTIEPDPQIRLSMALATALPELEAAKKDASNPAFKGSKFATLSSVIEAVRPVAEHGIWYRQFSHERPDGVAIETFYIGFGAEISAGVLFMPADKRNAQGFGSAQSYCRRYALQAAFGLASEDDDGNAASAPRKPAQAEEAPAVVSDGQWAEIVALTQATGTDVAKFCGAYSIASIKDLPAAAFPRAKAQLERKLEQMVPA